MLRQSDYECGRNILHKLLIHADPHSVLALLHKNLARDSRGRSSRRWNHFCVHTRVHASALSLIVHRIGVSAFQNSNTRSAQVGFLVLDIVATAIVHYRPTHLHLLSKRLKTNGDYILLFTFSSYDPLMCLRRYLDPHVGSDSSEQSRGFWRELWIITNKLIFRKIDIPY